MAVRSEIEYETNDDMDVLSKHSLGIVRQARLLGSGFKEIMPRRVIERRPAVCSEKNRRGVGRDKKCSRHADLNTSSTSK